ncbi:MAG: hypothetical protein HUU57_14900 [Bdellovibrio sp.]|nr:hypothetical protein [Bdellovibrio sp.]
MNALLRQKQKWESQNERYLLRLVETSADVSIESVKKAGLITSFLAYLVYKLVRVMLAMASAVFHGPQLVRHTSPEKVYETVDVSNYQVEAQIKNPYIWR